MMSSAASPRLSNPRDIMPWEPDIILPTQAPGRHLSADERLRIEVVRDAIRDLNLYGQARPGTAAYVYYCRAYAWLMGHGQPLDFPEICELFGWSAAAIRARVAARYPERPMSRVHDGIATTERP